MDDLDAIKALSYAAWSRDPIDDFRDEARATGPIAIMVMPDGSLQRLPAPESQLVLAQTEPKE